MKVKVCAVVMAAIASFLPINAAEVYTVAAGETFEVTDANNLADNRVDISGNATLKLSGTAVDDVFPLKINLNFVQDEVTSENPAVLSVDVADCSAVRMTGHVRNAQGGGKIHFPQGVKLFEVGAATRSGDAHTNFTAFQGDVSFSDADGCVKFVNDVSLVNLPTCAYSIADGSRIATLGKEALGKGDFEVSSYDVELCSPNSFSENATITVPDGKKLLVRPVRFSNGYSGTWGGSPGVFDNNVILGGADAHIDFLNKNEITGFTKTISGTGNINLKGDGGSVKFKGRLSYEGKLIVEKSIKSYRHTFALESGSVVVPAVVVNVAGVKFDVNPEAEKENEKSLTFSSFTTKTGVSDIYVAGDTVLTVGEVTGNMRLLTEGENVSVTIDSLAAGSVLYVSSGVAVTVKTAGSNAKVVFESDAEGVMDWAFSGPSSGNAVEIQFGFPEGSASSAELTIGGKVAISADNDVKVNKLTVLSGAEITANVLDGASIDNKGGVINQRSWKDKVALWVDASAENTFRYTRETWPDLTGIQENQLIEWRDCRADHQKDGDYRIVVTPFCEGGTKPSSAAHKISFPYADTIDDRKCVWLAAKSGRAFVANNFSKDAYTSVGIKFALLVFNGKNGGGNALLGTKNSKLKRLATTLATPTADMVSCPLVADASGLQFRTNGVDIASPTETPLTGGWQIIALSAAGGLDVGSICHAGNSNDGDHNGGQIFAEIMLFSDMPTETERNLAETYLSRKWNLKLGCEETPNVEISDVFGQGTVSLANDTVVSSGMFNGTVNLNGNRLELNLPSGKLALNESTIPAADRVLWIDPSLEGAVVFGGDPAKPDEVKFIHSRDNAGILTGDKDRCVASPYSDKADGEKRRVRLVKERKESGLVDSWLDFRNGYGDDGYRNHLQVKEYLSTPIPEKYGSTGEGYFRPVPVKAGFFALDSSRSGGSVILSTVGNASGFSHRTGNPSVSTPIWRETCSDQVKNSDTYLDGQKVEATAKGYNGRPEILSFNMKEDDPTEDAKVFGYSGSGTATSLNDEIMGEWILYSTTQTEDVRKGIEAYLMWKWLGKRLDGYSDFRGMTVVGDGVLAAAGPEYLPKLTEDFIGSLEFSRTLWEFALPKDGGTAAVDAVDLSGREVALPAAISVKISCKGAANGTYSLFKADALTGVEDVSISADSNLGNKRATLIVTESEISVRIESYGTTVVIR